MSNKNIKFKKCKIPLISTALGVGGMFLFSYLTFIPNQTFAESLIVDPNEHRALSDINTMQDMSQQICINSREEETKQLEDSRDHKKYWVTKLKDGNCWMTQNLDYDGGGTKTQNLAMWDGGTASGHVSNTTAAYYNPDENLTDGNKYYYNGPDGNHGWNPSPCTENTNGLSSCKDQGFVAATSGDNHYLVGNYYSWPAATTTSGGDKQSPNSVCPKSWRLPTSGDDIGEFRELMLKYGWTTDNPTNIAINMNNGKGVYGAPLYMIYGGRLHAGKLYYAGNYEYYWSSTPHSNGIYAYSLFFASGVNPSNILDRYLGLSVRCLAEGGGFPPEISDTATSNVSIKVSPVISIEVTKHATNMEVDFNKVARDSIVAKIGSNQAYQVLISTDQSNLEQTPAVENQNIPMIKSEQPIIAGTNNWGIKKLSSPTGTTVDENTIYSPVGTGDQKALFYTSNAAATESLTFPVAIAVSPTLLSGQYATQVTLTAVAN